MKELIKTIVKDYEWIHLTLGLIGNFAFIIGSVFFLPRFEAYMTLGVWLFIIGSTLMFLGSFGTLLVKIWDKDHQAK